MNQNALNFMGDETPEVKVYKPGTVKMPDGKEMNWEDGRTPRSSELFSFKDF